MKNFYLFILLIVFSGSKTFCQEAKLDTALFNTYAKSWHQQRSTNLDSAYKSLLKLDSITLAHKQTIERLRYLNFLGGYYGVQGSHKRALETFKASAKLAAKLRDSSALVKALFNVSTREWTVGNTEAAIEGYEKLHSLIKSTGKDHGVSSTSYANMTSILSSTGDYKRADFYLKIFKENRQTYNDSVMYQVSYQNLLFDQEKYKELIILDQKNSTFIKPDDYFAQSMIYPELALSYVRMGNLEMAIKTLKLAENVSKKFGSDDINIEIVKGEIALQKKKYDQAVKHFNQGLNSEASKSNPITRSQLLDKLHSAYKGMGKYKEAYEFFYKSKSIEDSINSLDKQKNIAQIAAYYQLEDKERIIAQKDRETDLQEKLLATETLQKKAFLYLLILTLLFLFFSFYLIKKSIKARNLLALQKNKVNEYARRLEKANLMRDKLFAMLSHDLRSPMNSLINALELYQTKENPAFIKIMNALNNIQLILNNLLKWSHLQLKDSQPQMQEVYADVWVEAILRQLASNIQEKDITILLDFKHGDQRAWVDEEYLIIIGRNLMSNAVKYTPTGGFIKITTRVQASLLNIEIRDSGVGIDDDTLSQIFNYPSSKKGTSGETGSGLGLTLCHELLEKMGGSINISSSSTAGTTVTLIVKTNTILQNEPAESALF